MYCLECAKAGAKGESSCGDPEVVLRVLRALGERGDTGARRLFFGILWDEGRSILCYRCKRRRPVRLTAEQREALEREAEPRPAAGRTPSTAVGEKTAEGTAPAAPQERRAA